MSSLQLSLFVASMLSLAVGCVGRWGQRSPAITAGAGQLGVAQMPKPFGRTGPDGRGRVVTDTFEIRRPVVPAPKELFFAGKEHNGPYSENAYAVSLDGQFRVRQLTRDEWGQAAPIEKAGERLSAVEEVPGKDGEHRMRVSPSLVYRGKEFARTGKSWTATGGLASPDGRWLAVFSHTSGEGSNFSFIPFIGGGGRGKGEMYIDVYDTATGDKLMSAHAPHDGAQYPDVAFSQAFWVESRYLIVQTDILVPGRAYFLGLLENERAQPPVLSQ